MEKLMLILNSPSKIPEVYSNEKDNSINSQCVYKLRRVMKYTFGWCHVENWNPKGVVQDVMGCLFLTGKMDTNGAFINKT